MMSIQQAIWQWFKYKKTSDYQYVQLTVTPYLQGSDSLSTMYKNAISKKQKECIMEHLVRFDEITMNHLDYRRLYNKLYDEFSKAR